MENLIHINVFMDKDSYREECIMNKNLSVVVLGAGMFGSSLAKKLFELNVEVMVVDSDFDVINELANEVTAAVQCDLFDEAVEELGLSNFDVAILASAMIWNHQLLRLWQLKIIIYRELLPRLIHICKPEYWIN